jgi:(E)-4-hydroxy-3-methylbut-2-enyl-diphosphate synthase
MTVISEEYTLNLPSYLGFRSREVRIGDQWLGGDHPVLVQSMVSTPTLDTSATVAQAAELFQAGCQLVRISAQNPREARNLETIRKRLKREGFRAPLCADIHFLPAAAEIAARLVEKVRINPGNYAEPATGHPVAGTWDHHAAHYRIEKKLLPLLKICREYGTALRIGVNHGSLSPRIRDLYGDTPAGMVESAMEYLRICSSWGMHHVVVSMKSSDIRVMVQSTRLIAAKMKAEGMDYPLHLGVTEAGDGEDGRIKSAAGIGILLEEGLGDTIRVSLTEDPVNEIPYARKLAGLYVLNGKRKYCQTEVPAFHPYRFGEKNLREGLFRIPVVVSEEMTPPERGDTPDLVFHKGNFRAHSLSEGREKLVLTGAFCHSNELREGCRLKGRADFLVMELPESGILNSTRRALRFLDQSQETRPVVACRSYPSSDQDSLLIRVAIDFGGLFTDGRADGIWIRSPHFSAENLCRISFSILQACGARITHTEYIACPSCGRTRFNIQDVLARVREATKGFPGLKIAVMGCIVNGPGEMADADYGYVGAGPGRVHLYRGKVIVKRSIPEERAVEELTALISKDKRD